MSLFDELLDADLKLKESDFDPLFGKVSLRNDADGFGDYIAKWELDRDLPSGFKVGKS